MRPSGFAFGSSTHFAPTTALLVLMSGCYGTPRTLVPAGEGSGGMGGSGGVGGSGGGVSGQGGTLTCAVACSATAYCDHGTCKSRITEFAVPTEFANVGRITSGPDGNLWFVEGTARKIGRITLSGVITEFDISSGNQPSGITGGPDGNVWFTSLATAVGRVTPIGQITEFPTPAGSHPYAITAGTDGSLYFTEFSNNKIGIISPTGAITEVDLSTSGDLPAIARGPDGNVWFVKNGEPQTLGRITPARDITEFPIPTRYSNPQGITAGSDGNLWFIEAGKIGRSTVSGMIAEFTSPTSIGNDITSGSDGNVWFAAGEGLGRVTPAGEFTVYPVNSSIAGISIGQDGNIWFTEPMSSTNHVARFLTP